MFKTKRIDEKKLQISMIVFFAILLIVALGSKIPKLCTVWGLPDEAGYISNAVWFLKRDWSDVRAEMPYYGYGYSVFLVPVFLVCKTGVALIRGAATFNLLCLIIIYFLQIKVMKLLYPQGNTAYMVAIAFITCLSPYLVGHVLSVTSEVLLALWVWIIALLLYKAIKNNSVIGYCILGVFSAYIFFIHARAIVILGTVYLTLFFVGLKYRRKNITKKVIISILIMLVSFGLLYILKDSILTYASSLRLGKGEEANTGNLLTTDYFIERLRLFFDLENFKRFLMGGAARLFYIAYATGAMAWYGIISLIQAVVGKADEKETDWEIIAVQGIRFFFLSSAVLMVFACVVGGFGLSSNWAYCFYARYYDYAIIPLMCVGCCDYIFGKQSLKKDVYVILVVLVLGLVTERISVFLDGTNVSIDAGRAGAFTSVITINTDYTKMILCATLILVLIIILRGIFIKKQSVKGVYLIIIAILLLKSDIPNINVVMDVHNRSKGDMEIASVAVKQSDSQEVYMLETPFRYGVYYARMQVLIKDKKLNVVTSDSVEEIPSDSYVFTYYDAALEEDVMNELEFCQKGDIFILYKKK